MKTILFDFDGVVADTMDKHVDSWVEAFKKYDVGISRSSVFKYEGMPSKKVVGVLLAESGATLDDKSISGIVKFKGKYYLEHAKTKIYPGFIKIFDHMRKNKIKTGLVTGTSRRSLSAVLPEKILRRFDVVLTSTDIVKGKPDPDIYLAAATRLGVAPQDCLVIENAPLGIKAAKAAGMRCIAIATTLGPKELSGADIIVKNHGELQKILRSGGALNFFDV